MSEVKPFSLEDLKTADGRSFETVPAHNGSIMIGSVSSADMLQWLEENEDVAKRRDAGLRLLVKSLVDPVTKAPLPADKHDEYLVIFRAKDAKENGKVIRAALKLNGMGLKADEVKNVSGEANSGASPTV